MPTYSELRCRVYWMFILHHPWLSLTTLDIKGKSWSHWDQKPKDEAFTHFMCIVYCSILLFAFFPVFTLAVLIPDFSCALAGLYNLVYPTLFDDISPQQITFSALTFSFFCGTHNTFHAASSNLSFLSILEKVMWILSWSLKLTFKVTVND